MALIYSDANPTNVYALDSDVLLGVAARLDIQDILALRLTNRAFKELTYTRSLWVTLLLRMMEAQGVFQATYDMPSMSTEEIEHAVLRQYIFFQSMKKFDTATPSEPVRTRKIPRRCYHGLKHLNGLLSRVQVLDAKLLPGGRYLLTTEMDESFSVETVLRVRDLGHFRTGEAGGAARVDREEMPNVTLCLRNLSVCVLGVFLVESSKKVLIVVRTEPITLSKTFADDENDQVTCIKVYALSLGNSGGSFVFLSQLEIPPITPLIAFQEETLVLHYVDSAHKHTIITWDYCRSLADVFTLDDIPDGRYICMMVQMQKTLFTLIGGDIYIWKLDAPRIPIPDLATGNNRPSKGPLASHSIIEADSSSRHWVMWSSCQARGDLSATCLVSDRLLTVRMASEGDSWVFKDTRWTVGPEPLIGLMIPCGDDVWMLSVDGKGHITAKLVDDALGMGIPDRAQDNDSENARVRCKNLLLPYTASAGTPMQVSTTMGRIVFLESLEIVVLDVV